MIATKEDGVIFIICCENSRQPNEKEVSYSYREREGVRSEDVLATRNVDFTTVGG
jgi:hypothetical protein